MLLLSAKYSGSFVDRYASLETFSTLASLCTHHIVAQGVAACVGVAARIQRKFGG